MSYNSCCSIAIWCVVSDCDSDVVGNCVSAYDGLFLSNGPGNPEMCGVVIDQIKQLLSSSVVKPIFGICLGHQLLSLAAGTSSYKML